MPSLFLLNVLSVYLLTGVLVGVFNYVATWRAFRRLGRGGELPENLLWRSVCWHAFAWPETAFWVVLLLLTLLLSPRSHK